MDRRSLQKKLVKLIPSGSARDAVLKEDFIFSDKGLLKIIQDYAPDIEKKKELFRQAKSVFTDKKSALHAEKLITYYERALEEFKKPKKNSVYEVCVKCFPDSYGDRYLSPDFDGALAYIKFHLKEYGAQGETDNGLSRYTVVRREILSPKKPSDLWRIPEDECVLGYKQKIIGICCARISNEWRDRCPSLCLCDDCKSECIDVYELEFPHFLEQYDLVSYEREGKVYYGVCDGVCAEDEHTVHIVLLNNEYIKERRANERDGMGYYKVFYKHDHVPFAELERRGAVGVPEDVRADYEYFLPELKAINEYYEKLNCDKENGNEDGR